MHGPIVAGTDGSDVGRLAIAEAGRIAMSVGSGVVVVFARNSRLTGPTSVFAVDALNALEESIDSEQMIALAQGIAELDSIGVPWTFDVSRGHPVDQLIKAAERHHANTIVLGASRRRWRGRIGRSSAAQQLVQRWPHLLVLVGPGDE